MRNRAAEKAFKAVLVHVAVEFLRTHDLESLMQLLRNSGIPVSPGTEQASELTRLAVEARYLAQLARFGIFSRPFWAFIAREASILRHRDLENGNYSH